MRNQAQQNFLVGAFFIAVGLIAFVSYRFLGGRLNTDKAINVVFADAHGIKEGELVQMAGVEIGQVDDVSLRPDNQAELRLRIHSKFRVPEGSRFTIKSGLLGNSRTLAVEPNGNTTVEIKDGATVVGNADAPLDDTLAESKKLIIQGQELIASLQKISANMEKLTGNEHNMRSLERTLNNTAEVTENLKTVTAQLPQLKGQVDLLIGDLRGTLASGRRAAHNAENITVSFDKLAGDARLIAGDIRKLTKDVDSTVVENKAGITKLLSGLEETTTQLADLLGTFKSTIADSGVKDKLSAAADNLVSISARMDAAASDLQRITGDPRLSADLREILSNVKETSASIRNLTGRLETIRIPGEKRPSGSGGSGSGTPSVPPAPPSATSLVEPGFVFDSLYDTTLERLRVDANYTLLSGKKGGFYRLGLYDATESNRLNAQIGRSLGTPIGFGYRYGLFAGKLGLGFDGRLGPLDFRLDLYDPNRFAADARVKAYLNRTAALTFGIGSIGKENRAMIGLQVRK